MFCILVSYIINVFIFLFIYFYTGPILIAVFITEMVILFKHIIIIRIPDTAPFNGEGSILMLCYVHFKFKT